MMQLALFEAPVRISRHDQMWQIAMSAEVEFDVMAIFSDRPDDWLGYSDFRSIQKKHGFEGIMGHVLHHLQRVDKIVDKNIYFGDDRPGLPNYLGFKTVFMLAEKAAA